MPPRLITSYLNLLSLLTTKDPSTSKNPFAILPLQCLDDLSASALIAKLPSWCSGVGEDGASSPVIVPLTLLPFYVKDVGKGVGAPSHDIIHFAVLDASGTT